MPSNRLLLIPSELGTVLERLGTLKEIEIHYSQALAKSKREAISHNSLLEAPINASRFERKYSPLARNINSTTNLVLRKLRPTKTKT